MPLEHLGCHADGFAERRMRMNGLADVRRLAAHLDRKADFADQVACMRADDAAADDTMARRIEQQLGEPFVATVCDGPAGGRPREDRLAELDAFVLALVFCLAGPGDFGIGVGNGWNLPRVEV